MTEPVVLRPRFGLVLCFIVWAIVALCIVSLIVQGDPIALLRFAPAFLLAAFACWVLFWAPAVRIDEGGVSLINLVRTVRITWPAVATIETKYAMTVRTVAGVKHTAWAAPGPSRFSTYRATKADLTNLPESTYSAGNSVGIGDVPHSDSGIAALYARRYWEQLRADGYLDSGVVEGSGVVITWHRTTLIVLAVLVVATLVGILL